MKKLLIALLLAFIISGCALKANVYKFIPTDSENIIQSSTGLQVSAKHEKTGVYPYLSINPTEFRFGGQTGDKVNLWGFGFGIEREVVKGLSVFGQMGWYQPEWDGNGEPIEFPSSLSEGLWIYLHQKVHPPHPQINFPLYSLEYKGNIGGVLGVNYELPLSDTVTFNIIGGYRYLKLREKVRGMFSLANPDCWAYYTDRNFSGWRIGIGFEYLFFWLQN